MSKIGLVLSSGGMRGLAQIGVLQELEKMNVQFDAVAGSSMGSIVGAFVAAGKTADEIEQFAVRVKTRTLFNFSFSSRGLQNTIAIKKLIEGFIEDKKEFSKLDKKLYISATDLIDGTERVFSSGNIFEAIRASIAVPGIFAPACIDEKYYIDGAVINCLPFSSLASEVDKMIIINTPLTVDMADIGKTNVIRILRKSIEIMTNRLCEELIKQLPKEKYLLIKPDVANFPVFASEKRFPEIIESGRAAARAQEAEIRAFLQS